MTERQVEINTAVSAAGCPAMSQVQNPDIFYRYPDPFVIPWYPLFYLLLDLLPIPGYKMIPGLGLFRFYQLKIPVP